MFPVKSGPGYPISTNQYTMRISISRASSLLVAFQAVSAATWGFKDGSISVSPKGAGVGAVVKEKYIFHFPLPLRLASLMNPSSLVEGSVPKKDIELGSTDSLKIVLTTREGSTMKRAHQTYLLLSDSTGLETSFPLQVKDSGKGKIELVRKLSF